MYKGKQTHRRPRITGRRDVYTLANNVCVSECSNRNSMVFHPLPLLSLAAQIIFLEDAQHPRVGNTEIFISRYYL